MTTFAYFITASFLKDNTPLNENVDDKLIKNAIKEAQDIYIQDLIGSDLYNELQTQIVAGNTTALNVTLLDKYIQPCLMHYAVCESALPLTYKFLNKSISTRNADDATPINVQDLNMIEERYRSKAVFYGNRLVNYLKQNSTSYPLFENYGTGYDVIPPNGNNIIFGIDLSDE